MGLFLSKFTSNRQFIGRLIGFIFLPGTVIHEFAHAAVAQALGVYVGKINLMPEIEGKSIKMGSVQIGQSDPFRRFLIGVAPGVLGVALILITFKLYQLLGSGWSFWASFIVYYLVFQIGNGMFSSRKDMEGALELIFAIAVVWGLLYFFGVRFDAISAIIKFAQTSQEFFSLINGGLFKILAINVGLILIFGLVNTAMRNARP